MIVLLAMGQSNAIGRGQGGADAVAGEVTVWNNRSDTLALDDLGSGFVRPDLDADPFVNGRNNMFLHMAGALAETSGSPVRLILVAKGGESIDRWMDLRGTAGPLYARMAAILRRAEVPRVNLLAWHQGESDEPASDTYSDRWTRLLDRLSDDGIIDAATPIVIGETARKYQSINRVLNTIAEGSDRIGIARISGLPTFDTIHFAGDCMPEIGHRYARLAAAMLRLP